MLNTEMDWHWDVKEPFVFDLSIPIIPKHEVVNVIIVNGKIKELILVQRIH
jgi:hypothetical protein